MTNLLQIAKQSCTCLVEGQKIMLRIFDELFISTNPIFLISLWLFMSLYWYLSTAMRGNRRNSWCRKFFCTFCSHKRKILYQVCCEPKKVAQILIYSILLNNLEIGLCVHQFTRVSVLCEGNKATVFIINIFINYILWNYQKIIQFRHATVFYNSKIIFYKKKILF